MALTADDVRGLVRTVLGPRAAENILWSRPEPILRDDSIESRIGDVVWQTMGRRAAAIYRLARIMTIDGNEWIEPTPGKCYSGTFRTVRKWTAAQRAQIRRPLPSAPKAPKTLEAV